jgi:hypothetical protein
MKISWFSDKFLTSSVPEPLFLYISDQLIHTAMKPVVYFALFTISICWCRAQNIAITDESNYQADSSAMLDVKSVKKGLLIPRLTMAQRDSIKSPANGLMVFQTDSLPGFYYYFSSPQKSVWSQVLSEKDACWKRNALGNQTTLLNAGDFVGLGLADPKANLHLEGNDGFIATGTFGTGNDLQVNGQGAKMIWYPKRAAFRAGYANNTEWDSLNIGSYSVAFGNSNQASGANSTATGYMNVASGDYSTATGQFNAASGSHSWVGGRFMQILPQALHTFVWGYSEQFFPTPIPTPNAFIIFPEEEGGFHGQVGIGTMFPTEHLDVTGTVKVGGLKMPAGANPGFVLTSDVNGKATWQSVPVQGIDGNGTANYIPKFTDTKVIANSVMYDDGSGNIGIGTESPSATLDVNGKIASRDNIKLNLNWISSDGNDEGIYINNDGKVGIGTNTPQQILDVNGLLYMRDNISLNGNWLSYDSDDAGIYIANNDYVGVGASDPTEVLDVNGKLKVRDNIVLNGHWLSYNGNNDGVFVSSLHDVGLGTASPLAKLDVNGKLYMRDNIRLNANWISGDGDDEGVYVNSLGKVGIGTSTPAYKLDVHGSARVDTNLKVMGRILPEGGIITPSNITIQSIDNSIVIKAASSKITVDPDGGITIESDEEIKVQTPKDISFSAKNISLTASNDINMDATHRISLDANENIELDAGGALYQRAQQDIDMHADQDVDISANARFLVQAVSYFDIFGGTAGKVHTGGTLDLIGIITRINNGGRQCARVEDQTMTPPGQPLGAIITGSQTVLIGN